jgi:D-mannose binding lectin
VGIWLTIVEIENGQSQLLPLILIYAIDVVWAENTENPITKLQLSQVSSKWNLGLTRSQSLIWSSNARQTKPNSTKLVLFDTGNLILQDQSNLSEVIWLAGACLGICLASNLDIPTTVCFKLSAYCIA